MAEEIENNKEDSSNNENELKQKPEGETSPATVDRIKDILVPLIQMNYTHTEHYQNQRSTFSNLLLIVVTAILAIISFDKMIDKSDVIPIGFLILVAALGVLVSRKYYERTEKHYKIYKAYRDILDREVIGWDLLQIIKQDVDKAHAGKFKYLGREPEFVKDRPKDFFKISSLWTFFHIIILVSGVILLLVSIFTPISFKEETAPINIIMTTPIPTPTDATTPNLNPE